MAKSVNRVCLLGYLGNAPDVKWTSGGTCIAEMRLATTERVKTDGDWQDRTEWHTLKAFNRTAEICRDYLHKGSQVYVEGTIHTDKWEDRETGKSRSKTEILVRELILLGGRDAQAETVPREESAPAETVPQEEPAPRPVRPPLGSWKPNAPESHPEQDAVAVGPEGISDEDIPF